MAESIYLDFNATAPIRSEVIDAMVAVMAAGGNPSSVHHKGRTARNRVEDARRQLAALIHCKPPEIIFTSGGTEANNFALQAFPDRRLIVSAQEHDSVLAPASPRAPQLLPVGENGLVDLDLLESWLAGTAAPALVSVMYANNETGVIQPIAAIAAMAHDHGALLHCDAIQAVGKIAVDFAGLKVDMMSVSAHKFGGPQGAGALVVREGLVINAAVTGGGQELGRRAGTENVAGIVGFGVAAALAEKELEPYADVIRLRQMMEARLLDISPESRVYGQQAERLPNTCTVSMPGVPADLQVMSLDLAGIAVSAGSACSSGKVKASHVLKAMGAGDDEAGTAIRVSLGPTTTVEEIEAFIESWGQLYQRTSPRFAA